MTDRERLMVSVYIPSPRDPDLPDGEYYITDSNERIQRVYISDINPGKMNESTVYGVRYASSGKRYGGDEYGNTHMWDLYDNKTDCRNRTHPCYDGWEYMRELEVTE